MVIFPAVDIKDGKCVRLVEGDPSRQTVYSEEPAKMAKQWASGGAEWIHVVDLDGALGSGANLEVIRLVRDQVKCKIQMGGGLRSMDTVQALLHMGVDRVVIGTAIFKDPAWVRDAVKEFPDRVIAGVDARDGEVKVEGWQEGSGRPIGEALLHVESLGIKEVIFTDISRDGKLEGPALDSIRKVMQSTRMAVVASGGVSSAADIKSLKALEPLGLRGCIVGKALYDGRLTLRDALAAAK